MTHAEAVELLKWFRTLTPSSPEWFQAIDHVVGVLLTLERDRLESKAEPASTIPPDSDSGRGG